jgi:glycosyltransferase involved in cell wall biosynthesis
MKIAFINQPQDAIVAAEEQRGSVAIVQWELARQLSARHAVTCYAPRFRGQTSAERWQRIQIRRVPFVARRLHKGIQLISGSLRTSRPYFASPLYFLEYFTQLARILREQSPDVIHLPQLFQFAGMLRRAVPSAKLVLHMHQDEVIHLHARVVLRELCSVDAIVTVSEYVTERIRSCFPPFASRIHTIYNGVDVERFHPAPYSARPAHTRLLFVGRISPDKGVHLLLDAFATLAAERSDLELTLVGKPGLLPFDVLRLLLKGDAALEALRGFYGRSLFGWFANVVIGQGNRYASDLKRRVPPQSLSRMHFMGTVPLTQLVRLYQAADLLVLPSVWQESYGLPIAEAMASGVPVLASRSGGIPELVEDGVTGRLVPRCDLRALTATLRTMVADREALREMGRAARARAVERMTWTRSAEALEEIYLRPVAREPIDALRMSGIDSPAHGRVA